MSRGRSFNVGQPLPPAPPIDHPVTAERAQQLRDEPLAILLGHPLIVGNAVERVGVELVTEIHFKWAVKYGCDTKTIINLRLNKFGIH